MFATKWDLRAKEGVKENEIYLVSGRGGSAFGYPQDNDKFIVLSGSKISDDTTKGFHAGYAELRDKLINSDVIKNGRFVGNYTFESPSAAAATLFAIAKALDVDVDKLYTDKDSEEYKIEITRQREEEFFKINKRYNRAIFKKYTS